MNCISESACFCLEGWVLSTFASRSPGLCSLNITDWPISSHTGSFPCTLMWPCLLRPVILPDLSFSLRKSDSLMISDISKWWCQKEKHKWLLILKLLILLRELPSEGNENSFVYFVLLKITMSRTVFLVIIQIWVCSLNSFQWSLITFLRPAVFYSFGKQIF